MTSPAMPSLPGFGAISETMEWVGKMWGGKNAPGIGFPGMVMPTLSVEEINKQISDLKAVESWLTLNMNMLRGTIQALEVQSATISTLRSMGETLNASVQPPAAAAPGFSYPFGRAAAAPEPGRPEPPPVQAAPQPAPAAEQPAETTRPAPADPAVRKAASGTAGAESPFAAPLANPAAWWTLLQDQFKQAVGTAMAAEPDAARGKPADRAGSKKESSEAAPTGRAAAKRAPPGSRTNGGATKKPVARPARKTASGDGSRRK